MVIGVRRSTSIGAGFANPLRFAMKLRMPSAIATAICPPSSGRSGSKLNMPTKIFNEATIKTKVAIFSFKLSFLVLAVSPLTRATPTTPTNPSGSRSVVPNVCASKSGIFVGSAIKDVTEFCKISPVKEVARVVAAIGLNQIVPISFMTPRTPTAFPSTIRVAGVT